ncbi:MAG: AAA domain-containing protein [Chloroflexi bacterium]|nr:AAA domain-containing protein [Chloroflexota bacterium]
MKFKFHLFVQKHQNQTYTATPLPFYDLTSYGPNLDDLKTELAEAVAERVENTSPHMLQHLEFNPKLTMRKVQVEIRPIDRKKRKKRREQVRIGFSLLVLPEDEGQLVVTVPKLGNPPLTFYAYNWEELEQTAITEITAWLEDSTLEDLHLVRHARTEQLDTLEVEVEVKKPKDRKDDFSSVFDRFSDHEGRQFWALREIGVNLMAQASEGRFRRAYHREDEVSLILQAVASARHNSVLVTGPAEVGKTAIIHEIVRRIHSQDCDEALHGRQVWMLSPDRIIAGAQFVGTWEERINNIVDECRKERHILYIPDLPGMLEVGRWSKSDSNVALALKPHIANGEVIIIGEAAPDRLIMAESLGQSFINIFRRVDVPPLAEDETLSLLGHVARDLERDFNVRILPDALQSSVQLSRRFWPYRAFPGKAIRLLEEATTDIAQQRTHSAPNSEGGTLLRRIRSTRVGRQDVIAAFARTSGMPEFIVNDEARMAIQEVENYFFERILGQEEAVEAMVDLVATIKAGLNDPNKPLGTFLFIGPTGVGKTQMAKTLAAYLFGDESRLIRFDMSEYSDYDGVARLIGAFNQEGELTRQVREQPFSVVLLDEFEKASPRIYDIFLQVLGEGRLTDAAGKTTFFHNTILVLTSNLGGGQKAFRAPGFAIGDEIDPAVVNATLRDHYLDQIEQYFRPEFINRLDKIVVFRQLTPQAVRNIAKRELNEVLLRDGITRRGILVEIDEAVIDLVLERGYSPEYGARPLKREIERRVVAPMARTLAQHATQTQNLLRVGVEGDALVLKSVPIDDAAVKSTVNLAGGLDSSITQQQRLDLPQLVEGFAALRRRLQDWAESDTVKEMVREKDSLSASTYSSDFWDKRDDARDSMRRFYFLDRLTRRLRQLQERVEYLEDFAMLVNRERDLRYQTELAHDYEELYNNVSFLDIELLTARLPHRNQAIMLIRPMGTPPAASEKASDAWMRRLSEMYLWWAERKGYDREIYALPAASADAAAARRDFVHLTAGSFEDVMKRYARYERTQEIALWFEGSNVFGFLKGERGLHRLLGKDSSGDDLVRVQVFALPDGTDVRGWLADYQRIKTDISEGRRPQPSAEKHTVIRVYSLDRNEKFVRDQRTGVRLTSIKDVMQRGQIDPFILAYLKSEEANIGWEDRFPPTFPFDRR